MKKTLVSFVAAAFAALALVTLVIKSVLEDVKISTIFYGVMPFILTDILRLAIIVAFPILATWLPSHM